MYIYIYTHKQPFFTPTSRLSSSTVWSAQRAATAGVYFTKHMLYKPNQELRRALDERHLREHICMYRLAVNGYPVHLTGGARCNRHRLNGYTNYHSTIRNKRHTECYMNYTILDCKLLCFDMLCHDLP